MKKQYVILGLGNFGKSLALSLENLGCDVIVIDNSAEKIQDIADYVSYAMKADFEDPEVLKTIGARNLDGAIVAVSENLEASILATLLAKEAGIPYVLAKASGDLHATILKKVGADAVVYPEIEMGERVAKNLVSSSFADWIELSPDYSMVEIEMPEAWKGKTLTELKIRETHEVNVVGFIENGEVQVSIDPEQPFPDHGIVIVIGSNKALQKFMKK